jgi:hypothetical protein
MNIDVDLLVRDYAEHIDSISTPVDIDELLVRRTASIVRRPRMQLTLGRGVAVGLAAFAVVLVGVGMAGFLRTVAPAADVATSDDSEPTAALDAYTVQPFLVGLEEGHQALAFDPSGWLILRAEGSTRRVEILPDGTAGETVVIAGLHEDTHGLALDGSGVVYFGNADEVRAVSPGSEILRWNDAPLARFHQVVGVAVDASGDLYVADWLIAGDSHFRIIRVNVLDDVTVGTVTEVATVPTEDWNGDIEFGSTGELFVLNSVGEIWVVAPDGAGQASVQMLATIPGQPNALAFNAPEILYVGTSEGTVWAVDPNGESKVVATGFDGIGALEFDTTGTLYLIAGNDVLKVTGLEGT